MIDDEDIPVLSLIELIKYFFCCGIYYNSDNINWHFTKSFCALYNICFTVSTIVILQTVRKCFHFAPILLSFLLLACLGICESGSPCSTSMIHGFCTSSL